MVNALGNPVRWLLSGGEVAGITQADALLEGLRADAVLADKGYDPGALVRSLEERGTSHPGATGCSCVTMIDICTRSATWLNVFSTASSNSAALLPALKNLHGTTSLCSTSSVLISGCSNC